MDSSTLKKEKQVGLTELYEQTRKCQYCGVRISQRKMTRVSTNPKQLTVWIEILGPEFAKNIKDSKSNYICLSHIENEERGYYRLPKNVNDVTLNSKQQSAEKTKEVNNTERTGRLRKRTHKITYFENNDEEDDEEVINETEEENNMKRARRLRTRTHKITYFENDVQEEDKKVINEKMEEEEDTDYDAQMNYGKAVYSGIKKMRTNSTVSIEDQEIVGMIPERTQMLDSETFENNDRNLVGKQVQETEKKYKEYGEVYAEELTLSQKKKMETEPIDSSLDIVEPDKELAEEMLERSEVLDANGTEKHDKDVTKEQAQDDRDETFVELMWEKSEVSKSEVMTMKIDKEEEPKCTLEQETGENDKCVETSTFEVNPQPESSISDKIEEDKEYNSNLTTEEVNREKETWDCVDMKPNISEEVKWEIVHTVEPPYEYFQCRVCDVYCHINGMTQTPTDPDKKLRWLNVLGPEYVNNITQNSAPHYVCKSHLSVILTEL